jgi:hypothetical protein
LGQPALPGHDRDFYALDLRNYTLGSTFFGAPMRRAALLLAIAIGLTTCAPRKAVEIHIGLELPLAGDAGADGLLARNAIETTLRNYNLHSGGSFNAVTVARDSSHGGSANAHIDEGRDASGLPPQAAAAIRDLARDASVIVAIGGLRPDIAAADAQAARAAGLPLIVLAPLPDGCRAAGVPLAIPSSDRAVSVRGGASLESLAVARLVIARGYGRVAIRSAGTAWRADPAVCLLRILRGHGAPSPTATPQIEGDGSALVYFAPAALGVLVCDPSGAAALDPSAFTEMGHRGYDSRRVPAGCGWLRQRMRDATHSAALQHKARALPIVGPADDILAAEAAAKLALQATSAAGRLNRSGYSKIQRPEIAAALADPDASQSTLKCSGASAAGAWFELAPRQRDWPAPVFIQDQRCFKKWASSAAGPNQPTAATPPTTATPKAAIHF